MNNRKEIKEIFMQGATQFCMSILLGVVSGIGIALLLTFLIPFMEIGSREGVEIAIWAFSLLLMIIVVGNTVSFYGRKKRGEFLFRCVLGEVVAFLLLLFLKVKFQFPKEIFFQIPKGFELFNNFGRLLSALQIIFIMNIFVSLGAVVFYHLFSISENKEEKEVQKIPLLLTKQLVFGLIISIGIILCGILQKYTSATIYVGLVTLLLVIIIVPLVISYLGSNVPWGNRSLCVFGSYFGCLGLMLVGAFTKNIYFLFPILFFGPSLGAVSGFHLLSIKKYKIARKIYLILFIILFLLLVFAFLI